MRLAAVEVSDFRSYGEASLELGDGVTVLHGANGSGKTNLLEALYCGCTGRGIRTNRDRELVRLGASRACVSARVVTAAGSSRGVRVVVEPGCQRRVEVDGRKVDGLAPGEQRPLVSVFMAERLVLVKGGPRARRAHVDNLVAALWPARARDRASYSAAVQQRNALLASLRAGRGVEGQLAVWDHEVARAAVPLAEGRASAIAAIADGVRTQAADLGLDDELTVVYRPSLGASDVDGVARELREHRGTDVRAGFCTHGPHRDEIALRLAGRPLRSYGSQGEQRLGLLALLLAEWTHITTHGGSAPLLLLDDVMSELDARRRARLVGQLEGAGQSVITATDRAQVPRPGGAGVVDVEVPAAVNASGAREREPLGHAA